MIAPDRPMTADELRGFNMALACLMRWGSQIERNSVSLAGPEDLIPRDQLQRHGGRMVRGCAEALALTMGKAPRALPAPAAAPAATPAAVNVIPFTPGRGLLRSG